MQSENFDKKIKETLSQRPPGNEKPEWDKMEKLLDKHLPVEKDDRRRVILLLFFFLLLGGGAFLVWKNYSGRKTEIVQAKPGTENSAQNNSIPQSTNNSSDNIVTTKPLSNENNSVPTRSEKNSLTARTDQTSPPEVTKPADHKKISVAEAKNNSNASTVIIKTNERTDKQNEGVTRSPKRIDKTSNDPKSKSPSEINYDQQNISDRTKSSEDKTEGTQKVIDQKTNEITKAESENKLTDRVEQIAGENKNKEQQASVSQESQPKPTANKTSKQKSKSSFGNNLFFAVSLGTDFSTVGLGETGKLEPVFGAGIGYQISKKLAVRTGFFTARKIYTANPEDYNPPANFWNYYPNLKTIDANCKVYEIPLVIDYTISQNKKQSWFASAGLSSLLMKKETYEYYFKPVSSPTYISYTRTITNQNKHYFSILDLSGGYTRRINKNISLRTEPYIKIALSGVGYGKVKLNSGGILVSAIIKPFAKK